MMILGRRFSGGTHNDQDKKGPRYKVALNGSWDENYGQNALVVAQIYLSSLTSQPWLSFIMIIKSIG